ncbi:MAG: 3-phosphoserine/phosphohydroxythreonine transaminase [Bacteroidota bacterium]|nr:3-phosphoserine/phosphohydroxythreonine transaminase [Bacteroidota bacterium]
MKLHNFCAGPAMLPKAVLQEASEAVLDYNNEGLSLLEFSHRGSQFAEILEKSKKLVFDLLGISAMHYEVLFLQGGARMEFARIPMNFLSKAGFALYLDTGVWAKDAYLQALSVGDVALVASSVDKAYSYIPQGYTIDAKADYFHCTSNNTIYGTQMFDFPKTNVPIICDMSSDIFSRKLDFSSFGVIYAGVQKNAGTAGLSLVVIRKDLLRNITNIPDILNYKVHVDKGNLYNTPAVFATYVSFLTLKWIKSQGGLEAMEVRNEQKARVLYNEIDRNPLLQGMAQKPYRSKMNVTFTLTDQSYTKRFQELCLKYGIVGIQGHRTVGGYRASIYNAMPQESVEVLVHALAELERKG